MTAGQLSPLLRHVAFALILAGLLVAEFLDLRRMGSVAALAGIFTLGGWAVAAYISWEFGE